MKNVLRCVLYGVLISVATVAVPLTAGAAVFYVNDSSLVGDIYTTAVGDNLNLGITPDAPMDSLETVLFNYNVDPGDVIVVDTGTYISNTDTVILPEDGGDAGSSVSIIGSSNTVAGGTVMVRNGNSPVDAVLRFSGTTNVVVQHIRAQSGADGFVLEGGASLCVLLQCRAESNVAAGVRVAGANTAALLKNSVVCHQGNTGVQVESGFLDVLNCTIFGQGTNGVRLENGELHQTNSIVLVRSPGEYCVRIDGGVYAGDYNNLAHDSDVAVGYTAGSAAADTLAEWQTMTGHDLLSLSHDPQLADEIGGDAHLLSLAGRFSPATGTWVTDVLHSPSIDVGTPVAPFALEPAPNGSRINQGAFGNTADASKSLTNAALLAISYNDGGTAQGIVSLRWLANESAASDIIRLDYSANGGLTWSNIAFNIPSSIGAFEWDTFLYHDSQDAVWRVMSMGDTNVSDETDAVFVLASGPQIVDPVDPDGFVLQWFGQAGRTYRVLSPTGTIDSPWIPNPNLTYTNGGSFLVATGANAQIVVVDTNAGISAQTTYAIEASEP